MARIAIRRGTWIIMAAGLLGVAPAIARPAMAQAPAPDRAATTPPPQSANTRLHDFTLRNLGAKPIEQASAHMTNGATVDITAKGRIAPSQAQAFSANNGGCLDSISIRFVGGASLQSQNLNDCDKTTVVVRDDKIDLASSAAAR